MDFITLLSDQYQLKKAANKNFSMRAFSRVLGENPAFLSKIMNRSVKITSKKIYKYSRRLQLEKEQICKYILEHLELDHQSSLKSKDMNDKE